MIEQRVDRATGNITVGYDGLRVMSRPGVLGGVTSVPFSGILFSTFFGGDDTSWGPSKTEHAYFAAFAVSTPYVGGEKYASGRAFATVCSALPLERPPQALD